MGYTAIKELQARLLNFNYNWIDTCTILREILMEILIEANLRKYLKKIIGFCRESNDIRG